jgi:hypothetical protein
VFAIKGRGLRSTKIHAAGDTFYLILYLRTHGRIQMT